MFIFDAAHPLWWKKSQLGFNYQDEQDFMQTDETI